MFCRKILPYLSLHIKRSVPKMIPVTQRKSYSLYEPDYLELMKSKIPLYDIIDIQIKGYDYQILESYQKLIHTIAESMNIDVEECWATPLEHFQVKRYKPKSNVVESEYELKIYERNVQVADISSNSYSVFLRVLEATVPEGVTLQVREHLPEYEKIRYVPDKELIGLKTQLDELSSSTKKK